MTGFLVKKKKTDAKKINWSCIITANSEQSVAGETSAPTRTGRTRWLRERNIVLFISASVLTGSGSHTTTHVKWSYSAVSSTDLESHLYFRFTAKIALKKHLRTFMLTSYQRFTTVLSTLWYRIWYTMSYRAWIYLQHFTHSSLHYIRTLKHKKSKASAV